jgi:hypothetical protein
MEAHPSKNIEVRNNVIRNQETVLDLTNSTDYYVGGNSLQNARMSDTTWSLGLKPPAAVSDSPYTLDASARIRLPAGTYKFAAGCAGGVRIQVDGSAAVESWLGGDQGQAEKVLELKEGVDEVVVQHLRDNGPTMLKLFWGRSTL